MKNVLDYWRNSLADSNRMSVSPSWLKKAYHIEKTIKQGNQKGIGQIIFILRELLEGLKKGIISALGEFGKQNRLLDRGASFSEIRGRLKHLTSTGVAYRLKEDVAHSGIVNGSREKLIDWFSRKGGHASRHFKKAPCLFNRVQQHAACRRHKDNE